jgi:hypothetical protein
MLPAPHHRPWPATRLRRSELFSYTSCVSYAVLTSLVSLDRVPLKSRVVDSPEIRSVIGHVPALETCLNALYDCKYKDFFKVGVVGLLTRPLPTLQTYCALTQGVELPAVGVCGCVFQGVVAGVGPTVVCMCCVVVCCAVACCAWSRDLPQHPV